MSKKLFLATSFLLLFCLISGAKNWTDSKLKKEKGSEVTFHQFPQFHVKTHMNKITSITFASSLQSKKNMLHLLPTKSVLLLLPSGQGPVLGNIGRVFARQVQQRCEAKVILKGDAALSVELSLVPGLGLEGFRIEDRLGGGVRIVGNDEKGLLFGVGKFLRTSRYDQGGFTASTWRGTSIPKCPVRAIYLATHFMNDYEAAPLEELNQYIEDLGLWGYNTILIHFPTWQFNGLTDPAARKWLDRFKLVLREAHGCGLQVGLLQVPGEGYKNAPQEFLATTVPGNFRGNFGVNLCVSKPDARAHLLEIHEAILDEFKNICLDYFCFWPYDEGGCACQYCWPWGARGYLGISREIVTSIRSRFPTCKIILSTWCFENENDNNPDGEWAGLTTALGKDKSWLDYIMADGHNNYFPKYLLDSRLPAGLGMVNFPEISMFGMNPWGGYGANPAPAHFEKRWGRIKSMAAGGAPYSEGIYEDLNKVIYAQFYWDPERKAEETVKEYAAFEFSADVAEDIVKVVRIFEQNHNRETINSKAVKAFELVAKADAAMMPAARTAWRWRILFLRALIDKELFERKGKLEGQMLRASFEELTRIYHAQNAHSMPIKPPQLK